MYDISFNHVTVDASLGWFHDFAIGNSTAFFLPLLDYSIKINMYLIRKYSVIFFLLLSSFNKYQQSIDTLFWYRHCVHITAPGISLLLTFLFLSLYCLLSFLWPSSLARPWTLLCEFFIPAMSFGFYQTCN